LNLRLTIIQTSDILRVMKLTNVVQRIGLTNWLLIGIAILIFVGFYASFSPFRFFVYHSEIKPSNQQVTFSCSKPVYTPEQEERAREYAKDKLKMEQPDDPIKRFSEDVRLQGYELGYLSKEGMLGNKTRVETFNVLVKRHELLNFIPIWQEKLPKGFQPQPSFGGYGETCKRVNGI